MSDPISELTLQEQELLHQVGRHLGGHLPALVTQWERALESLAIGPEVAGQKGARQESVASAYTLLHLLGEGQAAEALEQGRRYGETMALSGLPYIFIGDWLAALRSSVLSILTKSYAGQPQADQATAAMVKFYSLYSFVAIASFSARQQRLLQEQQGALRRSFEEAQRRVVELEVLNQVGQALNATMELDSLLEIVYQQTRRLMDASNFFIALCDWERNELNFLIQYEEGERAPRKSRGIGQGLTGHIARTGQALHLPHGPDEFLQAQGITRIGRPALSWLGVPLRVQDRVIGVMVVQSYTQDGAYDEGHLRILSTIAAQAAVAVDNARLYQEARRRADEMEVLYRLGASSAASLTLQDILNSIYEQASVVMDTSVFFVALEDPDSGEIVFELTYDQGKLEEPMRLPRGEGGGLTNWVIEHGQTLLIRDWDNEATREQVALVVYEGEMAKSILDVPLIARGRVLGVIGAQSYEVGAFDEHDRQVLETIAHQAAATIENARLYDEAQRRVAQFLALQQIGLKVASTRDLSEMLDTVADSAMELLHPNDVVIYLYDANSDSFTLGTGLRDTGERGLFTPAPRKDGMTAQVVHKRQIITVEDALHHPLYTGGENRTDELRSIVGVPLIRAGEVVGVLNVAYHTRHHFSEDELRLLQAFADQAAVAVSNAALLRRTQAVLTELQETSEAQTELLQLVQELSTPIVPLFDRILLMPLVGSIDSARGRQILDRLLQEVERQRAQVVLLDITGVPVVDTSVAQILLLAVQAVRLLGSEAVLVGITPEVAQTLVGLGVNLSGITTRSDLQSGVAYATKLVDRKKARAKRAMTALHRPSVR